MLRNFGDKINPQEHVDAIAFIVTERVKTYHLKNEYKIYSLKNYISKTTYCEITETVRTETGLFGKRLCGNCLYLTLSKPHTCECETLDIDANGEEIPHPHYQKNRLPSQQACKEGGFKPYVFVSTADQTVEEGVKDIGIKDIPVKNQVELSRKLLVERVGQEKKKKHKQICQRQYVIFCKLESCFQQGYELNEVVKEIAAQLKCLPKLVYRDQKHERIFSLKKCPGK